MSEPLTALHLLDRIVSNVGIPWQSQRADGFGDGIHLGSVDTVVTGIVTTFTPTMDVLKRAVASGRNTIICRETPFYSRGERTPVAYRNGPAPAQELLDKDATARAKRQFIDEHHLVIIRLFDNWDARKTDAQLHGLTMAIGWEKYRLGSSGDYFSLPRTTLGELARDLKTRLRAQAVRVIGDSQSAVRKAVLTHGFLLVSDVQRAMKEPGVDVLVGGEPVEWEATEYLEDMVTAGMTKGAIFLGHQISEEPGSGEMAAWLKNFVTEVPVEWIAAGEPFSTVAQ